jgi:uncharacterized membrane protein (DUF485 family)
MKKHVMVLDNYKHFIITNCKKNSSKIHFDEFFFEKEKGMKCFLKVIMLVHYISFAPLLAIL